MKAQAGLVDGGDRIGLARTQPRLDDRIEIGGAAGGTRTRHPPVSETGAVRHADGLLKGTAAIFQFSFGGTTNLTKSQPSHNRR